MHRGGLYCLALSVLIFPITNGGPSVKLACTPCPQSDGGGRAQQVLLHQSLSVLTKLHKLDNTHPCASTFNESCFQLERLSESCSSKCSCLFTFSHVVVNAWGGITNHAKTVYEYGDVSLSGSTFDHSHFSATLHDFSILKRANELPTFSMVVGMRSGYDHLFNHLSFQIMSHVGHFKLFVPNKVVKNAHFHCSKLTAVVLKLLGFAAEKIIVETSIRAENLYLAWLPRWDPWKSSSTRGSIKSVSDDLIHALKARKDLVTGPTAQLTAKDAHISSFKNKTRKVVYFSRKRNDKRFVLNQRQLLDEIEAKLSPDCELVVVGKLDQAMDESTLIADWKRVALLLENAVVLMGPHGGALNNLILAPATAHLVEFTLRPRYTTHSDHYLNTSEKQSGSLSHFKTSPPSSPLMTSIVELTV